MEPYVSSLATFSKASNLSSVASSSADSYISNPSTCKEDSSNLSTIPHAQHSSDNAQGSFSSVQRPLVYVTRRIPQRGMEILLKACNVKLWDAEEPVPRGELLYSVAGAQGILCMQGDIIDADILEAAGSTLQVVATMASVPSQHIDVNECDVRGVQVLTCPDQPTEMQADLTVALVLLTIKETQTDEERLVNFNLLAPDLISSTSPPDSGSSNTLEILTNARTQSRPRLIKQMSEERLAFQWNNGKPGNVNCPTWHNIVKKCFGIYGVTSLGLSVAKLLNSLGVSDVMIADCNWKMAPNSRDRRMEARLNQGILNKLFTLVDLDVLLEKSDVICVCDDELPTTSTSLSSVHDCELKEYEDLKIGKDVSLESAAADDKFVFNRRAFEKMKPGAIIVTSRSCQPAVDYVDLYAALRDGQIRAAGLNDCNQEPVPLKAPLSGLRNCVFLPQAQESVYDMRHKMSVLITSNLTSALSLTRDKSYTL